MIKVQVVYYVFRRNKIRHLCWKWTNNKIRCRFHKKYIQYLVIPLEYFSYFHNVTAFGHEICLYYTIICKRFGHTWIFKKIIISVNAANQMLTPSKYLGYLPVCDVKQRKVCLYINRFIHTTESDCKSFRHQSINNTEYLIIYPLFWHDGFQMSTIIWDKLMCWI